MKVYILDRKSRSLVQLVMWLSEDKRVSIVDAFEDYGKFIEHIGSSPPDFCIIRLGWDEIPGLKTADTVRQINPDIRIVFISDERDYALDAYEAGAYGYLLCPLDKDKLKKYLL